MSEDVTSDAAAASENPTPPKRSALEAIVLRLATERGAAKTICPTDAARASAEADGLTGDAWQGRIKAVRAAAVRLAKAGEVAIYRKGKPVDPQNFKGVYRIGLPQLE